MTMQTLRAENAVNVRGSHAEAAPVADAACSCCGEECGSDCCAGGECCGAAAAPQPPAFSA